MAEIWTMGEMIVEIMREKENEPLDKAGVFRGPYPSGAPAIFIDTVARLGHKGGIIGGVGKDDFGKCLLDRLKSDGVDVSHVIENPKKATGCAIVTYFDDGSRKFIFHMGNTPAVEAKAPQKDVLDGVRYFHVMGCSLFAVKGQEIVVASKRLADALLKLTEQRRNVLFLYFFFGYTDAQIGKEYGRNRSTANYWKLAALKQLRKEMERLEHEEQEADTL